MKNRICVLGGMNMDITGAPHASLCPGDSNPGTVRMTPGGVGRNIAENLARMGFQVELVAPLGNDGFATLLRQACMQDGIGLSLAPSLPMASSVYLCLMDGRGDMYAAVNDMALCESLSVGQLPLDALPAFGGVVLDANLPGPVLEAAAPAGNRPPRRGPRLRPEGGTAPSPAAPIAAIKPTGWRRPGSPGKATRQRPPQPCAKWGCNGRSYPQGPRGCTIAAKARPVCCPPGR